MELRDWRAALETSSLGRRNSAELVGQHAQQRCGVKAIEVCRCHYDDSIEWGTIR